MLRCKEPQHPILICGESVNLSMRAPDEPDILRQLSDELANFQDIAKYLLPQPGELPRLNGIDVCGKTLALNGVVGGDHIIYVDFKQRFDLEARIAHARQEGALDVVEHLRRCQRRPASRSWTSRGIG